MYAFFLLLFNINVSYNIATDGQLTFRDILHSTQPKHGAALGGPYLSVHLRRRDFIYARGDEIPSLKKAAQQMKALLKAHELQDVYIATDAPLEGRLCVVDPIIRWLLRSKVQGYDFGFLCH